MRTDLMRILFTILRMFQNRSAAGGSSLNITLPPEENSANRLVEQIQELIEFLANRWEQLYTATVSNF